MSKEKKVNFNFIEKGVKNMNMTKIWQISYGMMSLGLVVSNFSFAKLSDRLPLQQQAALLQQRQQRQEAREISQTMEDLHAKYKACSLNKKPCLAFLGNNVLRKMAQAMVTKGVTASDAIKSTLQIVSDYHKQHGYEKTVDAYHRGELQSVRCDFAALRNDISLEVAQRVLHAAVMLGDWNLINAMAPLRKPTKKTVENAEKTVAEICDTYQGTQKCESARTALEALKKFQ